MLKSRISWANDNDLILAAGKPGHLKNGGDLVREVSPKSPKLSGLGIIVICESRT